jgi:hypothetical protein
MHNLIIRYGYCWARLQAPERDPKYVFLKGIADSGASAIAGMVAEKGEKVKVDQSRLRVRHGAAVLDNIRLRIRSADVLFFDLDGENPNVMLELGIALANPEEGRFIFLLQKEGQKIPSDLNGYLISFYQESDEYKLVDPRGFYAALRSALIERAKRKGITLRWQTQREPSENPSEFTASQAEE